MVDGKKDFSDDTLFGEKRDVEFVGSHEGCDVQIIEHTHCSMMRRGTHDTGTSEMQNTERGSSAHEHSARACGTDADCVGDVNSALTRGAQHTSIARTHDTSMSEMQSTEHRSDAQAHSARACGTDADCVGDVNSALTQGMQHTSSARTHDTGTTEMQGTEHEHGAHAGGTQVWHADGAHGSSEERLSIDRAGAGCVGDDDRLPMELRARDADIAACTAHADGARMDGTNSDNMNDVGSAPTRTTDRPCWADMDSDGE